MVIMSQFEFLVSTPMLFFAYAVAVTYLTLHKKYELIFISEKVSECEHLMFDYDIDIEGCGCHRCAEVIKQNKMIRVINLGIFAIIQGVCFLLGYWIIHL